MTLRAASGATPVFSRIRIQNSRHWAVIGVDVRPRYASGADGTTAVVLDGDDLALENSRINYADDITGWSAADWLARAGNGLSLEGARITVRNNTVSVVDHGINSSATDTLVSGNVIAHFRGDGIRGLGDDTVYEYNTIKNAYAVDDNHDDGFQSWSYGAGGVGTGVVRGVVLRGNTIINYEDPNQPHRGNLQGIGLFDGMFEDWVVENNLVITDHWHGISFYGAINVRVVNNTVIDNDATPSPDPWIMIHDHKNGTPSTGTLVRNNIATDYSLDGGVTADHNLEITMAQAATHFVNPAGGAGDYHLKPSSPVVDAGSGVSAPSRDRDGALRPQGATWDLGAYELAPAIELRAMPGDHAIYLTWSVNTALPGTATWRIAYTGPTGAQASPISGLAEPTRAFSLTGLTNHAPYGVTVNAMVDSTPVLTDTVTLMPSDRLLALPVITR
ncbi:MAG TPA: right-handed parallel beta-helix repeat-containing protein [Anaerolineales bacterium]|nr:right-handed parallel beta-helix repeat-containing protein [Anaerolineales bacterium]